MDPKTLELEKKASACIQHGELEEAENIYQILLSQEENLHIYVGNIALIRHLQKRYQEAINLWKESLSIEPKYYHSCNGLASSCHASGDTNSAIKFYKKSLEINKFQDKTLNNLGIQLQRLGYIEEAVNLYKESIRINPRNPDSFNNLGIALHGKGELIKSRKLLEAAVSLNSTNPDYQCNLGNLLHALSDITASIRAYEKALSIDKKHKEAIFNLSILSLLRGDYKNGWEGYEHRFKSLNGIRPHAVPNCQPWTKESLSSIKKTKTTILAVSEQGIGDTFQFMRYILVLKNLGIETSICAKKNLHNIIRESGIDLFPLAPDQVQEKINAKWIPLLSIPRRLGVSNLNPVISGSYIKTNPHLDSKWRDILRHEKRPIIGIHWQGNPQAEKNGFHGRSFNLEDFATIANNTNANLVSLQKGYGSEQIENCSFKKRFVQCQDLIGNTWDFLENASIISQCDLVITNDTAIAHLSGGIGQKTWVLLCHTPDWRWNLTGDKTFWYDSIKLFRLEINEEWSTLMQRVALDFVNSSLGGAK